MPSFLIAPTGHSMPLSGGETCVGSDPSVQIPVRADLGLLPRHFAIAQLEGGWHLGAYEGAAVWVNGQLVRMTALRDGDRIVAGQLELIYREEPVVALPPVGSSMGAIALPPLQMGTVAQTEDAPHGVSLHLPVRAYPQSANAPHDSGGGWSIGRTGLIGVLMVVPGSILSYGAVFDWPVALKPEDLVIKEVFIVEAIRHQPRKGVVWTELHLTPSMNRIIELPKDLPFNPSWGKSMARIGFVKKLHDETHLYKDGKQVPLKVITLEVGGRSYRSLTMHNVVEEGDHQLFLLLGPFMLVTGLVLLMTAWKNWKVKRGPVRLDRADAMKLAGEALVAVAREM